MCGTVDITQAPSQLNPQQAKCKVSGATPPNGFYAVILNQSDAIYADPHDMPSTKVPKYYHVAELQTEYENGEIIYIIDNIPDRSGVQSGYKQVVIWAVWYSHGSMGYYVP